jgi:hypothetical protein
MGCGPDRGNFLPSVARLNEGLQSPTGVSRFAILSGGRPYFIWYFHGTNTLYLDLWMNCVVLLFDGIDSVQLGLFLVVSVARRARLSQRLNPRGVRMGPEFL